MTTIRDPQHRARPRAAPAHARRWARRQATPEQARRKRAPGRMLGIVLLVAVVASGCATDREPSGGESAASSVTRGAEVAADAGLGFLPGREVYLPQFAGGDDGSIYLVWREPGEGRGGNLFMARRGAGEAFGSPVQVNDLPGTVGGGSLDEGRPAVAIGPNGVIAVAWTGRGSDIRAAVSTDGGASFAPSLALNSDVGTRAYRGFVDIDVDAAGVAHAAWIDGRFAPRGAEEPAELYYARIEGGAVTEINLTEGQADSICGCCRIDVDVRADDRLVIAFRNTGGGYRDIWRIEAGADRVFGVPARLGPPMWELHGCPVIGPLNVGEATLWAEASTGKRRLLAAIDTEGDYEVIIEDDDAWRIDRPPRRVAGSDRSRPLLLLPGRPGGKILRGAGMDWEVVIDDVPVWAMSAALIGDELVVIGDLDGELHAETIAVDG